MYWILRILSASLAACHAGIDQASSCVSRRALSYPAPRGGISVCTNMCCEIHMLLSNSSQCSWFLRFLEGYAARYNKIWLWLRSCTTLSGDPSYISFSSEAAADVFFCFFCVALKSSCLLWFLCYCHTCEGMQRITLDAPAHKQPPSAFFSSSETNEGF